MAETTDDVPAIKNIDTVPAIENQLQGAMLNEQQLLDILNNRITARDENAALEPVLLEPIETRGLYENEKLTTPTPEIESPVEMLDSIQSFLSLRSALMRLSNYWMYTPYTASLVLGIVLKMANLSILSHIPVDVEHTQYLRETLSNTPARAYEYFMNDIRTKELDQIRTLTIVLANIPKNDTETIALFENLYLQYSDAIYASLYD